MKIGRTTEESFNVALGAALRQVRAHWSASPECIHVEQTGLLHSPTPVKPDLLIHDRLFPPVILECSFDAGDADRDAIKRLGCETRQGRFRIHAAIALHMDDYFRQVQEFAIAEELLGGHPIHYAVHQLLDRSGQTSISETRHRRWPSRGFIQGTVFDLAALLPSIGLPLEQVEAIGDQVARLVEEAASGLEMTLSTKNQERIAAHLHQRSPLKGLRTMMVLWLNALLTQQRLAVSDTAGVPPLDFTSESYPDLQQQMKTWRDINELNWNSVFEPAIEVLHLASQFNPRETSRMLSKLITAVLHIETAQLGLHISIGAELFPKLSEDRKQAAAFYTQPATAELLAGLTLRQSHLSEQQWSDALLFTQRHLSDLACGTGTLLRAGYRRLAMFHEQAGGTPESLRSFHTSAMEGGLIGTDISPIAAHLTASSLAALGYGDPYGDTQIGWVEVGGARAQTGALEYFTTPQIVDLFHVGSGQSTGNGNGEANSVTVQDGSIDWIMMNPPYSRTRGGQSVFDIAGLSDQERKACQKRWRDLVKHEPVNKQAGLAASFLDLARLKCKPGGRIGFVLPLSAAFAESWSVTRRMIEEEFEEILVLAVASGQALGKQALSADTQMEEMLLIATKRKHGTSDSTEQIQCVTLRAPVVRVGEAAEMARAIQLSIDSLDDSTKSYPVQVGEDEIGQVYAFDIRHAGAPWNALGVLHADLALAANALLDGHLIFNGESMEIGVPMTTIGELFTIGPTHDLIGHLAGRDPRGAFELNPVFDHVDAIGPDRALWKADSSTQTQLMIHLTHKGSAPKSVGSKKQRDAMRQHRSTLFYARNMRWTSQALLAAITHYRGMGGRAWASLQHEDEHLCKCFALWANSTLGFLIHWTQGQRTQSGRSTAQMKALSNIPCPQLDLIPAHKLKHASMVFDELSKEKFRPACQAHTDPVRKKIDHVVAEMLGIDSDQTAEMIRTLRWLWCNEPSVHGQNREAITQLKR